MNISFQTWEGVFVLNICLALLFPLFKTIRFRHYECSEEFKDSSSAKSRLGMTSGKWIGFILFFLPYILALVEYVFSTPHDIAFHFMLITLHWIPSFVCLATLVWLTTAKNYYFVLLLSLILSISKIFFSSNLWFLDPFWGVIPGTISIDPIISLGPYWIRLLGCGAILILLSLSLSLLRSALNKRRGWGRGRVLPPLFPLLWFKALRRSDKERGAALCFPLLFTLYMMILGCVQPSPFLWSFSLKKTFKEMAQHEPFQVFVQDPESEIFSAETWAHELSFHFKEMSSKLPRSTLWKKKPQFTVFIYKNHKEKNRWLGAHAAQIGHFFKGEIHLSEITPLHPTLRHEIAHLIHGNLKAPWVSYLDPFYFEGFAEALSHNVLELIQKGGALLQTISSPNPWPRYFSFFTRYPPVVSYRLAGGFSAYALKKNQWPWDQSLKIAWSIHEPLLLYEAQALLEIPSYFSDPLRRDCARVFDNHKQTPHFSSWRKVWRFCQDPQRQLAAAYQLPNQRQQALQLISDSEAQGDLAVLQSKIRQAEIHYSLCLEDSCFWKFKSLNYPKQLKMILKTSHQVEKDVLKLFPLDLEALKTLLLQSPFEERIPIYDKIDTLTPLEGPLKHEQLLHLFYWTLTRENQFKTPSGSKILAKKILKEEKRLDALFRMRLEWEIRH